ncbi:MAG: hypothetical protein KAS98_05415, partial [Deltaproteobacteria bacterium]|nr:hypothetical protein [Deltaproteobacteria bacterium]
AEQGGTPEMCEEFPLEAFESFEQVKAFCTEKGGPPEICASIEAKCREFGVTTANECFLLLSISSVKAYSSTELKSSPAPSFSEGEMEERRRIEEEIRRIEEEAAIDIEPDEPVNENIGCAFNEMIFYISSNCEFCEKVKDDGTISKIEELGVKVTQINVEDGPVEHKISGVPAFVINKNMYMGYKTFKELSELLGCL